MMEPRVFAKSLAFGALAALATGPFVVVTRPVLGSGTAVALWCILLASGYVACIAPSRPRGIRLGTATLGLGLALLALASPSWVVLGSAVLVAVFRSGFLFRARPARALVIEASLLGIGLSLVQLFASHGGPLALSFGVWAFFLVESLYFLAGGASSRPGSLLEEDPFESACRKAARLMEDFPITS